MAMGFLRIETNFPCALAVVPDAWVTFGFIREVVGSTADSSIEELNGAAGATYTGEIAPLLTAAAAARVQFVSTSQLVQSKFMA
jgi:hypothetical protein